MLEIIIIGTFLIFLPFLFVIGISAWWGSNNKNEKTILEKSQRIKTLLELNKTIQFKTIQTNYHNHHICNSKRQLDKFSIDNYLMTLIDSNESFYRNIIETISYNRTTYNDYITKTRSIASSATEDYCKSFGFKLSKFQKYEERLFKKHLLKAPPLDVVIRCEATYTSPQGKNHYSKEEKYSFYDLQRFFNDTMKLKLLRILRRYLNRDERAKMNVSLRYDILKRDNFRCQICGSSAQDGVKLHVDHIIPVSKGGKTIWSNLRTLCDRCNLGKSDKL